MHEYTVKILAEAKEKLYKEFRDIMSSSQDKQFKESLVEEIVDKLKGIQKDINYLNGEHHDKS